VQALSCYKETYPPVVQTLENTSLFSGDRHGDFRGDKVAILSDGSGWKVHRDSASLYQSWQKGEHVRVMARRDWYWFNREHHFYLYNEDRDESIKVMLVKHKENPLTIVSTHTYFKYWRRIYNQINGQSYYCGTEPAAFRKLLTLSDGSQWVVRDNFNRYNVGQQVYIGAHGDPDWYYDFLLICLDQREAVWDWARPQAYNMSSP
jgi:hypothetical protein